MKNKKDMKYYLCIIFFCIIVLLPILIIAFYVRPAADDFNYTVFTYEAVTHNGTLFDLLAAACRTVKRFYLIWQGTYTSAFFMSLQPGIWGHKFYILTPYIFLMIIFVSLFISVSFLNKRFIRKSRIYVATITMVLLTVLVLWLPSPNQGLFWYNGAMHYIPWFFASVVNISLLVEVDALAQGKRKRIFLAISSLLSFVISGGNQVTAFMNILLMLVLLLVTLRRKKIEALLPLCAAILGFIIMYIAPGNTIRQSNFERKTAVETVISVLKYALPLIGDWISLELLVSWFLITPFAIDIAYGYNKQISCWTLVFSLVASFAVFCGMLCVIYMPTGFFGEARVTNVIWLAFMVLSWFNYCLLWVYAVNCGIIKVTLPDKPMQSALVAIACLCILFVGRDGGNLSTSYLACNDLFTGSAQQHARELDQRFEIFYDDSIKEVALEPLTVKPRTTYTGELNCSPDMWPNDTVAKYFNKEKVYVIQE